MRYNKDGSRCLRQLRKELEDKGHSVYRQGNNWIMSRNCGDHNRVQPAPYWATERDAIEIMLHRSEDMLEKCEKIAEILGFNLERE